MDKGNRKQELAGWVNIPISLIDFGSWFFLSESITNIDFGAYDTPVEYVRSCTLCISAFRPSN
jgi:epoxyqueuosine reductase QueG